MAENHKGYIAVDLDGTLAEYHGWCGPSHIGKPIPAMVERVKQWLAEGKQVRIFTARVDGAHGNRDVAAQVRHIQQWCLEHLGEILVVTNEKDYGMEELWDDRCVQVEKNTGRRMDEHPQGQPTP